MTHHNQTILPNSTISGGSVSHVGQIFFDQSLIEEVTKTEPYASNKQDHMLNKQDFIMAAGTQNKADNVVQYVLIGDKLEDGLFAWINFGIDVQNDRAKDLKAAATCYEDVCVAAPKSAFGPKMGEPKGKDMGGMPGMPDIPEGGIPGLELPEGFGNFSAPKNSSKAQEFIESIDIDS